MLLSPLATAVRRRRSGEQDLVPRKFSGPLAHDARLRRSTSSLIRDANWVLFEDRGAVKEWARFLERAAGY